MTVSKPVQVAITSDLMCPWCWVGLRKLQQASKLSKIDIDIVWKPFLLRPNLPPNGLAKGGTPQSRVGSHLKAAGQQVGIDFTGLTDRTPNTVLFHASVHHLQQEYSSKVVTDFHENVFEGYFTNGVYPDEKGLLEAARNLPKEEQQVVLDSLQRLFQDIEKLDKLKYHVVQEAQESSRRGISGVPSFAFDGVDYFSGAQPVETFMEALKKENVSTSS